MKPGLVAKALDQHLAQLSKLQEGVIDADALEAAVADHRGWARKALTSPSLLSKLVIERRAVGAPLDAIVRSWTSPPAPSRDAVVRTALSTFRPKSLDIGLQFGESRDWYAVSARVDIATYQFEWND
ncbi:MAG: hypothetical protein HC923_02255 [Myxococcales bacterium]|nr:hypothetical protein [Myxococcales bacterium]